MFKDLDWRQYEREEFLIREMQAQIQVNEDKADGTIKPDLKELHGWGNKPPASEQIAEWERKTKNF